MPGRKPENGSMGTAEPVDKEVTPTTQLLPVRLGPATLAAAKVELQSCVQDETEENKNYTETITRPKGRIKQIDAEIVQAGHASDPEKGGERVATLMAELERTKDELGELKSRHDLNVAVILAKRNKLARIVQSGVDYSSVDCQVIKDYAENSLRIVRLDNGEVIEERPLEGDERQRALREEPEMPSREEDTREGDTVSV